jgi:hypothetical protein
MNSRFEFLDINMMKQQLGMIFMTLNDKTEIFNLF